MSRFGAVDVHDPPQGGARAALVVAADLELGAIVEERVADLDEVAPYVSGQLFRRELPSLLRVLAGTSPLDLLVVVVVVDSYVDLDPEGTPGLGRRAREELDVPVIGVAKTRYRSANDAAAVVRGGATSPLHVTCAGISLAEAVRALERMDGEHRIPRALRRVDALARGRAQPLAT